jgi:micrococcal nuclease
MDMRAKKILACTLLALVCVVGVVTMLPRHPQQDLIATSNKSAISAASFEGRVIRVSDGDSITVRSGTANIAVRLAEIDAPERGQAWGNNAREELAGLVAGRTATIHPRGRDRYGRTIAIVWVNGRNINQDMVLRGAAWAYRAYQTDPVLTVVENQARARKSGLWSMPPSQTIPPWDFRAQQRERQRARQGEIVAR